MENILKFTPGDITDNSHCTVLTHEFFRCDDAFKDFCIYAEQMILQGQTRETSYKAYNAYTSFIHHLYEFLMGCHARDVGDTEITKKKHQERLDIIDGYIMHHAQRIMNQYKDAIKNGTAPSWVNDISYYDVIIPSNFAKDFRQYRNKAIGHVAHERALELSLSEFYDKYHKFLYYLYKDSLHWWGQRTSEFPDLQEITDFSVMISKEKNY